MTSIARWSVRSSRRRTSPRWRRRSASGRSECSTVCRATRPSTGSSGVSIELTTMMLATLFDFPWEERRKLTYWSDVAICNVHAPESPVHSEQEKFDELKKMAERMAELYNERAKHPPKFDLLSMLAQGPATQNMPLREL